jgi:DNA-binding NarL/FixJ family response regulator
MAVIWLIEDNPAFREATEVALSQQEPPHVCKPFESCETAVSELKKNAERPEVILLDVGLPGVDGITGIKALKELAPEAAILILTVFDDDEKIFRAICAGASGYLLKAESLSNIGFAIEQAVAGGSPMNPQVARRVLAMFSKFAPVKTDYGLSNREREILERMVNGFSKKEIASQLDVSVHTVNTFVRIMYKKLHVNCQTAAVSMALRQGIIDR